MTAQPLRVWMAAVIAAPAIVLAGAGIAAAQTSPSSAAPSATPGTAPAEAAPRAKPEAGGPGARDGHRHGHHHHAHHHGPRGPVGTMGVRPDADGNVSRTDVQAAQQRQLAMFDKMDANHDGVISKDERAAFYRQMREARQSKAPGEAPAAAPSKG